MEPAAVYALVDRLLLEHPPATTNVEEFLGAQFDHGLAWVHFPVGCGGLGADPGAQALVDDKLEAAGAPVAVHRNPIGNGMAAPTLVQHGTPAQCERYLRPLFTGAEVWCQLYSEPGAGSDVAGLATAAAWDNDSWVVNGQKVWTTLAHVARWGLLLARTDPDAPKHEGMTCFVVDMTAPGIDVVPLFQMTGEAEFNEVFLADVRIPDAERLGPVGGGWAVSITTLMNERVAFDREIPPRGGGFIGQVVALWRERRLHDAVDRDAVMRLWVRAEVLRLTALRARQLRSRGTPGPEGSIGKVAGAELNQDLASFCVDLLGAHGTLLPGGYRGARTDDTQTMRWTTPQHMFLRLRANSIEGGTTEILKNVLGERVLGLPGDIRVDKGRPWREVARS